jgi:thiol-disulfide isomerase/thioredoxin
MSFGKINFSKIFSTLLAVFAIALIFSPRLKSWLIMGLMTIGFFKPDIPSLKDRQNLGPAPAMLARSLDGKTVDLQQEKGKVVFVNFWATWCPPCLAELPSINSLYQEVKKDPNILFVTVDVDNNLEKSTQFLKDKGFDLPVYGGDSNHVPDKLFENGIPTTLVIDKKGNLVFTHFNRANYDNEKFLQFLSELSKE